MIISFEKMPDESRVWIYQSSRKFSEIEKNQIIIKLNHFLNDWTAHGSKLSSSFQIKYNRFIIIALDEKNNKASGCSIDTSVRFIQELEKEFEIDLMDKMNVVFKQGDDISYKSIFDFKKLIKNKSVSINTIVFNNLVVNKADLKSNWEIPASESWHSRLFL